MLQSGTIGLGIALMALSGLMVFIGRPRNGQVVGFLRGSSNVQSFYCLALMCVLMLGVTFIIIGSAGP